jgi:ribonuclease-3
LPRNQQLLEELLDKLGTPGIDQGLIWQALTHSSYANEESVLHNERLEFLGDAVLELLTSQYLYERYPTFSEGELTRLRANLVCEPTLAEIALELGLGDLLLLGKSQLFTGGQHRPSLLADAVEALLGAVYIWAGLPMAEVVYERLFQQPILALERGELWQDYKTRLQELAQKQRPGEALLYQVVSEAGPDHDKTFFVALTCAGRVIGRGKGRSKKEAEQMAAKEALRIHFSDSGIV